MTESINQPEESALLKYSSYIRYPFSFVFGMIIMAFACTVFTFLSILLRNRKIDNFVAWAWGTISVWVFGLKIKAEGHENLPKSGCLLLFNHASLFDIPIMYNQIKKDFRFGAKAELFKVPFLGMALKSMGALPIHRARRDDVLKLYESSVERINCGESFALAPEGTRQNEPRLGKFKSGPFIFAIQAQTEIVPVVIKGALETLSKNDWIVNRGRWTREVKMQILPPVSAKGFSQEQLADLQELVRGKMLDAYNSMD